MKLLVCVKRVPAPGARINITADLRKSEHRRYGAHGRALV